MNKKKMGSKIIKYIKSGFVIFNVLLILITISSAATSQTPYSGTALKVPGIIQAEDFDNGGEGIAYHDTETANQGNQYRPADGVDIEKTSDTGGGYNIGWALPGEWLAYTVNVANNGNYNLETRVAYGGTGGTFHIEFNGFDKTGPITVPDTGSYQTWTTLTKTVSLSAGQQVMKIVMDKKGDWNVANINYFRLTPTSTPIPAPTITPAKTPTSTPTPAPTITPVKTPTSTPTPTPTPSPIVSGAFYVTTNGNDANPGTESQPWRTIQKAANTLTAGQTVYVKAGTYNEQVTVRNSGSAGKYITFSAYLDNIVIVDGTGINMDPGYGRDGGLIQIWGKSYIKVSGFTIINSGYAGLFVNTPGSYNNPPSHDIIFEGNTIKDSWAAAIIMFGRGSSNAENYVARNNIIIRGHMGGDPMAHESLSVGGKISNFEISGNTIKDSFWGAIDSKDGVYNGKIFGNTCTNTEMSCVYVDGYSIGADNIDVFDNVVHDMKNVGTESNGFNVNSEQGGPTTNIRFYNNLVYNNPGTAMRMSYYRSGTEGKVDRITITSNTFFNNGVGNANRGGISIERSDATNTVIRNNIIFQNGFGVRNSEADAIMSNNLETNPLFLNPSVFNFHLHVNSPAINKGSSANAPGFDFDGKARPSGGGYDIGAYEY